MTTRKPLAAVLLDLDGTLLDTAPDLAAALNLLRAQEGLAPLIYAPIREQVSVGSVAVVRHGFPAAEEPYFAALLARFLDLYRERIAVETRLFPGFAEVLAELEHHRIPWGVITNKPARLTDPLMRALGLYDRAVCVLSGDSLAERKPHPLPLLTAAARIGVEPRECLYLGDALRDMQAAQSADMVALGARFGYLPSHEDLTAWPVTAWIDEPTELLSWVGLRPAAA